MDCIMLAHCLRYFNKMCGRFQRTCEWKEFEAARIGKLVYRAAHQGGVIVHKFLTEPDADRIWLGYNSFLVRNENYKTLKIPVRFNQNPSLPNKRWYLERKCIDIAIPRIFRFVRYAANRAAETRHKERLQFNAFFDHSTRIHFTKYVDDWVSKDQRR